MTEVNLVNNIEAMLKQLMDMLAKNNEIIAKHNEEIAKLKEITGGERIQSHNHTPSKEDLTIVNSSNADEKHKAAEEYTRLFKNLK